MQSIFGGGELLTSDLTFCMKGRECNNNFQFSGFTDGTVIFAFTVIFRTGTVFKKQYQ